MSGEPYQRCSCRDPETRRPLGQKCPRLQAKGHALGWFYRYDAPRGPNGQRRQPEEGPFRTKKDAREDQAVTLARLAGGGQVQDRSLRTGTYLTAHAEGKIDVKPRTQAAIRESITLYWLPALGHLRLVDLRDHHIAEALREMTRINRPLPDGERPSEMLRRMLAARAPSPKKGLPPGDQSRKSVKPLSPARLRRVYADLHAALAAAVPGKIAANHCDGVVLPRVPRVRPLAWTAEREAAFRTALDRRISAASAERPPTAAEKQRLWATMPRPSPVMVLTPVHTGRFLDFIEGERLYALFCLVAYCGLRRDEVTGLAWAEVNLEQAVIYVRETGSGDGPKSEAGTRAVPIPGPVVAALRAWRKRQAADQLAWGPDWTDSGRVFSR